MAGYHTPVSSDSTSSTEWRLRVAQTETWSFVLMTCTSANGCHIEFKAFIKHTELELRSLFDSIDRNHDGSLDYEEVADAFRQAGLRVSSAKLKSFFNHIDTNNDGRLDFEEWR
jgi:Ca2+-binding EF-hand superfamily protein